MDRLRDIVFKEVTSDQHKYVLIYCNFLLGAVHVWLRTCFPHTLELCCKLFVDTFSLCSSPNMRIRLTPRQGKKRNICYVVITFPEIGDRATKACEMITFSKLFNVFMEAILICYCLLKYLKYVNIFMVRIFKANEMHYFSDLFDNVLYIFRTCPLSITRSISTLYTRNRCLSC
jgi:hypothetical protein